MNRSSGNRMGPKNCKIKQRGFVRQVGTKHHDRVGRFDFLECWHVKDASTGRIGETCDELMLGLRDPGAEMFRASKGLECEVRF